MSLHPNTFEYLSPSENQLETMQEMRFQFAKLAHHVDDVIRPGPDKDHIIRLIRDAAMWANVAITRDSDGAPR